MINRILYKCDPNKNTACSKTKCFINGGPCNCTTKLLYAVQPLETVKFVMPVTEQDLVDFDIPVNREQRRKKQKESKHGCK